MSDDEIEIAAKDALDEIHKHTTLCINENEEHIFLVGFSAGIKTRKLEMGEREG